MMNTQRKQAGYSLLEMLLVMTLMGIILVAGMAWHTPLKSLEHRLEAQRILDVLWRLTLIAQHDNSEIELRLIEGHSWALWGKLSSNRYSVIEKYSGQMSGTRLHKITKPNITFSGQNHSAAAGKLRLTTHLGEIDILISSKGRLRKCASKGVFLGLQSCG